jgi:hypothetical protein
MILVHFEGTHV